MLNRTTFLEVAAMIPDLGRPLSRVMKDIPVVPTISTTATLDRVWKAMVMMRCEEVMSSLPRHHLI